MLQARTPQHAGSREQARELIGGLAQPLAGQRVAVDFGPLLVPTPSYCDEIVKLVLETGGAERLEVLNASLRGRQLIERSAQNRGVTGRLRIAAAVG
jgi:hypothetical protein